MKVTLQRLLTLLECAVDKEEQMQNLAVSLGESDAYHAMTEEGYYLVTPEMALTVEKADKVNGKLTYKTDFKDVLGRSQGIKNQKQYDDFLIHFYRYLGQQEYILPIEQYREAVSQVASLGLTYQEKAKLLSIALIATTGEHNIAYPLEIKQLANIFKHKKHFKNDDYVSVLTELANWQGSDYQPSLEEFELLVNMAAEIPEQD